MEDIDTEIWKKNKCETNFSVFCSYKTARKNFEI